MCKQFVTMSYKDVTKYDSKITKPGLTKLTSTTYGSKLGTTTTTKQMQTYQQSNAATSTKSNFLSKSSADSSNGYKPMSMFQESKSYSSSSYQTSSGYKSSTTYSQQSSAPTSINKYEIDKAAAKSVALYKSPDIATGRTKYIGTQGSGITAAGYVSPYRSGTYDINSRNNVVNRPGTLGKPIAATTMLLTGAAKKNDLPSTTAWTPGGVTKAPATSTITQQNK